MKKLLVMILSAMLLLTACGEKATFADGYETARPNTIYSNLNLNGTFYTDTYDGPSYMAQRLWFFDFDSMKSAIMCARPNCKHDDHDVCTAFGLHNYPTVVGNKLYFFETESECTDYTTLYSYTNIWRAELDGGSRLKFDTIDGLQMLDMVIKGSVVYFTAKDETIKFDPEAGVQSAVDPTKYHICSYDFENKVYTDYGILAEGYNGSAYMLGEYNGGLYIRGSYDDEKEVDLETRNDYYLRLDLKTGEIKDWDMPISSLNEYGSVKPMFADGGFYGYMDGDNTIIFDSEGAEIVFENYELSGTRPVNGYIFNTSNGTAIDLSKGEIVEVNTKVFPKYGYVFCYHDGYIISSEISKIGRAHV